jgi:tripartite-type tricarboxylate transporter receptor subunit TctC
MLLSRRQFMATGAGVPALVTTSWATSYPARPVRLTVGFTPGSTTDILARLIGQWLTERLGQPFIVENRPGAGSRVATEAVVQSAPDGHTLLLVVPASATNATLYPDLSYNFMRDIAPVSGIIRVPYVLETSLAVPARSIPELIDHARSRPRTHSRPRDEVRAIIWPGRCSISWPGSRWSTCRIAAPAMRSRISSQATRR